MKDLHCEDVGGFATALALNKPTTQVAVAGRSIFKIYNINDKGFELVANLRVVKNAVASCNDVAWNQIDESVLASATPSGAIVIWNLNKPGFSKMDTVYQDHRRTVNRIHFHSSDPWLLVSGSQDSIKVFDLRQNQAVIKYSGLSESIRDLQFCPHKPNVFVAVQDNGCVQLYDMRKKDKYEQCFPAHNGPIFACDWHPEIADSIATAGRDMSIKVWSISGHTPVMMHCIPTMESVSKIRWSYENTNHIASCSLKRDYSINIWDIHRPYIACARFTEPHEVTTGFAWQRCASSLIAITSTGNLYQLPMSSAYRPLEHTNPVGMAINPVGDIALALGNGLFQANTNHPQATSGDNLTGLSGTTLNLPGTSGHHAHSSTWVSSVQQNSLPTKFPYQSFQVRARQSATRRSQDSALRPRISSRSQLDVYKCTEMNWFVKTAQEYQLSNRSLAELCDHNAEVCAKLKRFQVCQTWKILKLFYANIGNAQSSNNQVTNSMSTKTGQPPVGADGDLSSFNQHNSNANQPTGSTSITNNEPNNIINTNANSSLFGGGGTNLDTGSTTNLADPGLSDDTAFGGISDSLISRLPADSDCVSYSIRAHQGSRNSGMRTKFSSPINESFLDDVSLGASDQSNDSTDEWLSHETLSYEAFQTKHDICGRVDRLIEQKKDESASSSSSSNGDDEYANQSNIGNSLKTLSIAIDSNDGDLKVSHSATSKAYQFKFYEIIADVIADVLKYHVDNSDVQSAVSTLIVLGDRIKNIVNERIPEVDRESWYYSYIDLLSKFQLWNVMAQVINLSPLSNINSINQTSTTIYTTCGSCNRPLNGKVSWLCDRCKTKPSECSICHGVVAGLMAWCQGCYHGGHLVHMSQWFSENSYCPTGCGHMCEFSQWR